MTLVLTDNALDKSGRKKSTTPDELKVVRSETPSELLHFGQWASLGSYSRLKTGLIPELVDIIVFSICISINCFNYKSRVLLYKMLVAVVVAAKTNFGVESPIATTNQNPRSSIHQSTATPFL